MVNKAARESSEVLDGLHSGVRPSDLPEFGRPGTKAQLQPFHGRGEPTLILPNGTLSLPREQDMPTDTSARPSDEDAVGQAIL